MTGCTPLGEATMWSQVYDPLNNAWLSTVVAALPVIVLLGALLTARD